MGEAYIIFQACLKLKNVKDDQNFERRSKL